jgi:hypothetical protein
MVDMVDSHLDEGVRHKPSVCGMVGKCFDEQGPGGHFSKRNLDKVSEKVMDRATRICKKKDAQGDIPKTSNNSPNSFSALSDLEIVSRASKMGVKISYDDFETVNLIREMEAARENLSYKVNKKCEQSLHIENVVGERMPLSLEWLSESDREDDFVVVESRKKRKSSGKKNVVVSRPMTRSQSKRDISAHVPGRTIQQKKKPEILK